MVHNDRTVSQRLTDFCFRQIYRLAYQSFVFTNFWVRISARGAYVAVWHQEQVLLIKNGYKSYLTFPSGNAKRNEGIKAAAMRELSEEVGLDVKAWQLDLVNVLPYSEKYAEEIVYIFELQLQHRPKIKIDHREVVQAHWATPEEALQESLCQPVRSYLVSR